MAKRWKLSPSDLTFLWDECKRCFYLKVVHQFTRPSAPFPRIFGIIDTLMNTYFQGKSSDEISPDLPEGVVEYGEKWVVSQPIVLPNHASQCFILGRFDTVIAFSDGTYAVVDFKTTEPKPGHISFYSPQLHAYAYALEHPVPGKLALSPIKRLGLLCVEPTAIDRYKDGRIAYIGEVSWLEIPKDETQFLDFIGEVLTVLEQPEPPSPGPRCGYCHYREQTRISGW
jgi:CRISPR/Cas system-associated exonuclease Cas4 (RecB family)